MIGLFVLAVLLSSTVSSHVLIGMTPVVEFVVHCNDETVFCESDSLGIVNFHLSGSGGTVFVTSVGEEMIRFQCFDRGGEE